MRWRPIPINAPLYLNLDEKALGRAAVALENVFINEAGGHTALGNLVEWARLPQPGRVFLHNYHDELIAVTGNGRCYHVDRHGASTDRTGVPVAIDSRPTFAETDDDLLIAGGGAIIRLGAEKTDVLADAAPETTHVAYVRGYVLAIEKGSGRVVYSEPGLPRSWPVLNAFTAEDKPDPVVALVVNQFNEIIIAGSRSVELHQVGGSATRPFYRRSSLGYGVFAPGTMIEAGQAAWAANSRREFVRLGQVGAGVVGGPIGRVLEQAADWRDAWAAELLWAGQKFVILQIPHAATPYGGTGRTLGFNYAKNEWFELYAWDQVNSMPMRLPVWSAAQTAYGTFLGGDDGAIYRMDAENVSSVPQRSYYRSAPISASSVISGADEIYIDNVRLRLQRRTPAGIPVRPATMRMRARVDDGPWHSWITHSLDQHAPARPTRWLEFGSLGTCSTVQFEYESFAGAPFDISGAEILAESYDR